MLELQTLFQDRTTLVIIVGIFGLLVGSFLNVVIYRLPIMLNRQWKAQALEFLAEQECGVSAEQEGNAPTEAESADKFNLVVPRSACPHCGAAVTALQNIPVLSYLFLRGQCASCKRRISPRYPFVELLTSAGFSYCAYVFGADFLLLGALIFTALLIAMSGIDMDHKLLPDQLTYSLLWAGLLFNLLGGFATLQDAVIGALAGYLSLWSVYWLFKLATGKEGMGYGDFKLFAALGAWLGWQLLPLMIIVSAVTGLVLGGGAMLLRKSDKQIPFGPFLAIAGWLAMFFGAHWVDVYLRSLGV